MKKQKYLKATALACLALTFPLLAQNVAPHEHPGFLDYFLGDGDAEFVCYSKIHRNFFLVIFLFGLAVAIGIYRGYRIKKKTAEELAEKNQLIEEQNKDITDSMRYARRLQEAVLPDHAEINRLFGQNFVYCKPRDIVSGDFYWAAERNGKQILAVADCTGHGFPGAFLSIIGHLALNKAVNEEGHTDPSRILDVMNTVVKNTLGQGAEFERVADGMEVGICVLDKTNMQLEFAGAGRYLLVSKKGNIEEIKGDKCSVGSHQPHVSGAPKTHLVKLDAGDSFYLGSDGITDQFGGQEGKKFGRKALTAMLAEVSGRSIAEQKTVIDQKLDGWKGTHAQTDDMMLVGVQV
ncbi:MAG: hypothetical protein FD123_3672 [Bacteroidetes bacterium]|nr:MAG: hypothetical protein FD123_3672 [Bacteroidota bacterium]